MIDKIDSPEKLNKLMRVSKLKIWVMLGLVLILIVLGLNWFVRSNVVIEESHPIYIFDKKTTIGKLIFDLVYEESGKDKETTDRWISEVEKIYGKEYTNREIYPACLFVSDLSESEMVEQMEISASDYKGIVLYTPMETFDYMNFFKELEYTEEDMRRVGMNPGVRYVSVIAAIWADQISEIKPGLYKSSVILDVLKPMSMIIK